MNKKDKTVWTGPKHMKPVIETELSTAAGAPLFMKPVIETELSTAAGAPLFRQKISEQLGVSIPKGKWRETIKELDTRGRITSRIMLDLVITLCIQMEELLHESQFENVVLPDTVSLFNPRKDTFTIDWLDDDNVSHTLIMPSREISYFPSEQAQYVQKHLADLIFNERSYTKPEQMEEIVKEITVDSK